MSALIAIATMTIGLSTKQQDADAKAKSEALMSAALTATELKFEKSKTGLSFTGIFDNANNRRRQVFVSINSNPLGPLACHLIYTSVLVTGTTPPTEQQLVKTLAITKKLGSFYVFKDTKGAYAIRFGVHFDAATLSATPTKSDASVITLKDTINFVNQVGEEMAQELAKG